MNAQNEKQDVQNLKLVSNEDGWKCVEVNGKSSVIPNSWSVRVIGKEIRFTLGHTPPKEGNNYSGETCWVTISNLDSSGRVSKYSAKISSNKTRTLPKGSLVGSFKMTIGRFGILEIPAITNEAIVGAAPEDAPNHNLNYLRQALVKPFKDGATINGQGVQLLNTKTINSLSFVAPPLPEQQRIADVLTSQESRIEDLRAWAQTERDRLTWLTDELLSGRVRVVERIGEREVVVEQNTDGQVVEGLVAYELVANQDGWKAVDINGENSAVPTTWEVKTLGECSEIRAGQSPDGHLVYTGTPNDDLVDFHQGNADFSTTKTNHSGKVIKRNKAPRIATAGTLLMSVRAPVGALNFASNEICFGRGLTNIQAKDISKIEYLRWKIASSTEKLTQVATGSTFLAVTNQQVSELQISLPPLPEQHRIATVLNAQERQIADIEQLIEIEQQRLSWLTDELLSGRVRVVENT